jgi:hypothetical protein
MGDLPSVKAAGKRRRSRRLSDESADLGPPVQEAVWGLDAPPIDALTAAASEGAADLIETRDLPIEETVRATAVAVRAKRSAMPRDEFKNRDMITGSPVADRNVLSVESSYQAGDVSSNEEPYGEEFVGMGNFLDTGAGLGMIVVGGLAAWWLWKKAGRS